jgi:flagellar biosynthesis component FlhA
MINSTEKWLEQSESCEVENPVAFSDSVGWLAELKAEINAVEVFFAEPKRRANLAKQQIQDEYNKHIPDMIKARKSIEGKMERWVLHIRKIEKEREEETGIIVPSEVPVVDNFSMSEKETMSIIDDTNIPREYLMVDERKIKELRRKNSSFELPGVEWTKGLTFTNTVKKEYEDERTE